MKGILHPEAFHGTGRKAPFFEGWYIKLVSSDKKQCLALIPGIFQGTDAGSEHAFLQVVQEGRPVRYLRFPPQAFHGAVDRFECRLDESLFSDAGVNLNVEGAKGEVRFSELSPWPVRWTSPGVMGWYAWVPFMQCYHGVVSLDHALEGQLVVGDETYDFDGGRGYIEKDWGFSFPKRWVWMQSNSFDEPGVCVSISIADVPWLGYSFPGFLIGFWRRNKLIRMTTYTGAKITQLSKNQDGVVLSAQSGRFQLEAHVMGGAPVSIFCPSQENMEGVVREHVGATLRIKLEDRKTQETLFDQVGKQAAYEVQGDLEQLT